MNAPEKKQVEINKHIPLITTAVSVVLWIIAASIPAYFIPDYAPSQGRYLGIDCYLWGFWVPLYVFYNPLIFIAWFSNAIAAVALLLLYFKQYTAGMIIASIALACALCSLLIRALPMNENDLHLPAIVGPGLIIWLLAIVAIVVGHLAARGTIAKFLNGLN